MDAESTMEKIRSPELRRFASEDTEGEVSVLIEVDLPVPEITFGRATRGEPVRPTPTMEARADSQQQSEQRIREARHFLETMLGANQRWLGSAGSFVARVKPAQLRAIAQNPLIKAVWSNRELRRVPEMV